MKKFVSFVFVLITLCGGVFYYCKDKERIDIYRFEVETTEKALDFIDDMKEEVIPHFFENK